MRARLVLGATAVLLLTLAACGGGAGEEPVSIRFGLSFVPQGAHAGWYVGIDEGFYAEEGLEVEVLPGESSHATVSSVAAGALEMGEADFSALIVATSENRDLPVTAVFPFEARAPYTIATLADGINATTPEELDGAEIGLSGTSVLDDVLSVWARRQGLTGLRFQSVNPAAQSQLLLSGQLEATLVFTLRAPQLEAAAAEAGREVALLDLADWGMEDFYGRVAMVNDDFAAEHPDAVEAFVRAALRGWQFALDNPDEAGEHMQRRFPTMEPAVTAAQLRGLRPLLTDGGRSEIGVFDLGKISSTLEFLRDGLGLDPALAPEDLYSTDYTG